MEQPSKDLLLRDKENIEPDVKRERKSAELAARKEVDLKSPLHLKYDKH